jgi:hypothetical protein
VRPLVYLKLMQALRVAGTAHSTVSKPASSFKNRMTTWPGKPGWATAQAYPATPCFAVCPNVFGPMEAWRPATASYGAWTTSYTSASALDASGINLR